jgi:hypothetical protein
MLFKESSAVSCENQEKDTNVSYDHNADFRALKHVVRTVTTGL